MTAVMPEKKAALCMHEMTNCVYCRPRPKDGHPQRGPWSQSTISRHCGLCGGPIHERDRMRARRADGRGGWLCVLCGIGIT